MSNKAKETFLFINSVILKPNSKLHHYNMSELVVKLKLNILLSELWFHFQHFTFPVR